MEHKSHEKDHHDHSRHIERVNSLGYVESDTFTLKAGYGHNSMTIHTLTTLEE